MSPWSCRQVTANRTDRWYRGSRFLTGPSPVQPVESKLIAEKQMADQTRARASKHSVTTANMTTLAKPDYITEKLTNALLCLATYPGGVKKRRISAIP